VDVEASNEGTMMTRLLGSFSVDVLARRSWVRGTASIMDLRGDTRRQYRFYDDPDEDDAAALADDWHQIGQDMAQAADAVGYGPDREEQRGDG
jgi:hypothetical protein